MEFIQEALKVLPSIAGSPLALIGYLVTVGAWVWAINQNHRIKNLLNHIKEIPESDRAELIRSEMGVILPEKISAGQWIQSRVHRYFLVAFVVLAITVLSIFGIAVWKGSAKLDLDSVQQVLSIEGDELELSHTKTEQNGRRFIFDITLRNPSREPVSVTDIRIVFEPSTGRTLASVEEISGTYVIRVSEKSTITKSPLGNFEAYAWYPSGFGRLYVKSPLAQTVEPTSVDRFRVIVQFPNNYPFRGDMKEAQLQVMWNDARYVKSEIIKLSSV